MPEIYLTQDSYEDARKKGKVKESRLLSKFLTGVDDTSFQVAYEKLKTKAKAINATAIYNLNPTSHGSPTTKDLCFIVTGDVYA